MATLKTVSGSTLVSKAPAPNLNNALITAFGTPKSRAADKEAKAKAKAQKARDAQKAADIAILTGGTPPYVPEEKEESKSVFDSFTDTFSDIFGSEEDEAPNIDPMRGAMKPDQIKNAEELLPVPIPPPDTSLNEIRTMPVTPDTPPSRITNMTETSATDKEKQAARTRLYLGGQGELVKLIQDFGTIENTRQEGIVKKQVARAVKQSNFLIRQIAINPDRRDEAIKLVIADNESKGLETKKLRALLGAPVDEVIANLQYNIRMGADLETIQPKSKTKSSGSLSNISQLNEQLALGNINPAMFAIARKALIDTPISNAKASIKTEIYENGTTVMVLDDQSIVVKLPDGTILKGEEAQKAIDNAIKEEIKNKVLLKGKEEQAIQNQKYVANINENLGKVRVSIRNADEALKVIQKDGGALTGPVISRIPSFRAASIQLDNIQKRMGLDIVGATTFGALSKGELDLALGVALPTMLRGPELIIFLENQKKAQEQLIIELERAAIYLGEPGNSMSDFIKLLADERKALEKLRKEDAENTSTATQPTAADEPINIQGYNVIVKPQAD